MTTPDNHLTLGATTYHGDLAPEYVGVQMPDGTIVTERTWQSVGDPAERLHKVAGGIIDSLDAMGVRIPCARECATHNCRRPCNRIATHPDDSVACICDGCAFAMAGEGIS